MRYENGEIVPLAKLSEGQTYDIKKFFYNTLDWHRIHGPSYQVIFFFIF
jgi:hypothetical protein